ncbi:MAG: GGDEF domain-containing protein [Desulfobacteraceae bacterium]
MKTILNNILLFEYLGFITIVLMLWINEIFDIPHYCLGFKKTPVNWPESIFETICISIFAAVVILSTKKMLKKIQNIAMYDPLTELMNRNYIYEYFQHIKTSRSKRFLSVILCDLDYFKTVNDTYGHDCGDYVLKQTARLIKNKIRPQDMASRWGGEEFLLLLPEISRESAFEVAERIRREISSYEFRYKHHHFKITMSFGIAGDTLLNIDSIDIISLADQKLYQAKKKGRNQVAL